MQEHAVPVLRITSGSGSLEFYGRLGFEVEWEHRFGEDFPLFASIKREAWHLFLSEHGGDAVPYGLVYLYTRDIDALFEKWLEAGVGAEPPHDQPWGMREVQLVDPDGNRLRVGSPVPSADRPGRDP